MFLLFSSMVIFKPELSVVSINSDIIYFPVHGLETYEFSIIGLT